MTISQAKIPQKENKSCISGSGIIKTNQFCAIPDLNLKELNTVCFLVLAPRADYSTRSARKHRPQNSTSTVSSRAQRHW